MNFFTDLSVDEIEKIKEKDINEQKIILANLTTAMLHGEQEAKKREEERRVKEEQRRRDEKARVAKREEEGQIEPNVGRHLVKDAGVNAIH